MGEQCVLLTIDEGAPFAAESGVLLAYLVERIANVSKNLELVEKDRRLRRPGARVAEQLPHVYHRKPHSADLALRRKTGRTRPWSAPSDFPRRTRPAIADAGR